MDGGRGRGGDNGGGGGGCDGRGGGGGGSDVFLEYCDFWGLDDVLLVFGLEGLLVAVAWRRVVLLVLVRVAVDVAATENNLKTEVVNAAGKEGEHCEPCVPCVLYASLLRCRKDRALLGALRAKDAWCRHARMTARRSVRL